MAQTVPQSSDEIPEQQQRLRLKYLDFVQVAAAQAAVCLASLYEFAKSSSGPLKPGVQAVEATVNSVVGPVYDRFHDVPLQILSFVDRKVDEKAGKLERHVPAVVKEASSQAYAAARSVAGEVQRDGVRAATAGAVRAAKELCVHYEPVAERYAATAWGSLNKLPLFPQVAHIAVPTAAYWSEKYNSAVRCAAERGYGVADYLPLVPTERIAKVFGGGKPYNRAAVAMDIPVEGSD